jgi:single-stranded-DNA-specific exonuclease
MLLHKQWIPKPNPSEAALEALKAELPISDVLLKLIVQRQIFTIPEARAFFLPEFSKMNNPLLMKDMLAAISRIHLAIEKEEKIMIYGDYDVDGEAAVALVYTFFKKIYSNLIYYIPDRFKEGYGISSQSIEFASTNQIGLVIVLDCGIKSVDLVAFAQSKGIDYIICDHHKPGPLLPNCVAILNPKREGCPYPFKELTATGIGYKLVEAYSREYIVPFDAVEYLDLVTVSIASDLAPVIGENRIMAHYGLKRISEKPRPGIKAIMQSTKITGTVTFNDLIFRINPRLNSAGRMSSGHLAVEILIQDDLDKAQVLAKQINVENEARQVLDKAIFTEALEMMESSPELMQKKTIVLYNPNWHKGVIAIVAARLIDQFYKPTILLTESNGIAIGSARSVAGFDLYSAIEKNAHLLDQWGGHFSAVGLNIPIYNIEKFAEAFEAEVSKSIKPEQLSNELEYDIEVPLSTITPKFSQSLDLFAPFGPFNPKPVFLTRNIYNSSKPRLIKDSHIQINLGEKLKAILFNMKDIYEDLNKAESFDICYTIEPNNFRKEYHVNLYVKDIILNF